MVTPDPRWTGSVDGFEQQAPTLQGWESYAEKFGNAWANPAGGKAAWLKRLRPLVTDRAYAGLQATDLTRIPTATVRTVGKLVPTTDQGRQDSWIDYEGFSSRLGVVMLAQADGGWKINAIDLVRW